MVGSSKILTVSYGTFSCTLEGFDEPFNTMKSIAEYFRDLAADDRYFGAEPPTPDAEMLHRIAEREISNRVEARVGDSGVVLRQVSSAPAPIPAATAPQPAVAPAAQDAAMKASAPAEPARSETAPVEAAQAEEVDPAADNVAAKLARIRAAVARTRAARDAMIYDEDLPDAADTAPATARAQQPAAEAPAAEAPADDTAPAPAEPEKVSAAEPVAQDDLSEDLDRLAEEEEAQTSERAAPAALLVPEPDSASAEDVLAAIDEAMPAEADTVAADPVQPETAEAEMVAAEFVEDEPVQAEHAETEHPETEHAEAARVEDAADDATTELADLETDAAGSDLAQMDPVDEMAEQADDLSALSHEAQPDSPVAAPPAEAEAGSAATDDDDTLLDDLQTLALDDEAEVPDEAAECADAAGAKDHPTIAAMPLEATEEGRADAPAQVAETAAEEWELEDDDIFGEHLETLSADTPEADAERDPAAEAGTELTDAGLTDAALADADDIDAGDEDEDEDIFAGLSEDDEFEHEDASDDVAFAADGDDRQPQGAADAEAEEGLQPAAEAAEPLHDLSAGPTTEDDEEIEIETEDTVDEGGRPQARIIRLKRRDFEAALAAGDLEEVDEDDEAAEAAAGEDKTVARSGIDQIRDALGPTSLDPAEEEALLQELAEVERDAARGEDADEDFLPTVDDSERNDSERALDRLLSKTNAKLGETEGSRRRSAIAHLKAAVAATKADRLLKGGKPDTERESAINKFRDDLAQVVRPRRPQDAATAARAESRSQRPAPLMLVSELRVDRPAAADRSGIAVRPRRISAEGGAEAAAAAAPSLPTDPVSFAEFARRAGATELPDLLEAAAAYATFVEGQDGLSRPQILRRAASVHADADMSREEGLRSFGHLLNSGRIRRLGRGRFAVSDETRYATLARASGE